MTISNCEALSDKEMTEHHMFGWIYFQKRFTWDIWLTRSFCNARTDDSDESAHFQIYFDVNLTGINDSA
jgi:hypothetical protein